MADALDVDDVGSVERENLLAADTIGDAANGDGFFDGVAQVNIPILLTPGESLAAEWIPTAIESGLKDFEVVGFYGFLAPAGTPPDVVAKLSDAFKQVLTNPEVRNRMVSQGADPAFLDSAGFAKFLEAETPRWEKAVKASGAKMD